MITRVFFRVDSSLKSGIGHVMRCLALANALRLNGVETHFICRNHAGHIGRQIKQAKHFLTLLPPLHPKYKDLGEALDTNLEWLGASWETDAQETVRAFHGKKVDWVVVDNYIIDDKWESFVRSYSTRIMVIGGLPNRKHDCDMLHDQNYYKDHNAVWSPLVSAKCKLLLGPAYALLRPEFSRSQAHHYHYNRSSKINRIAISFGGVDLENVTGYVLEAVLEVFGQAVSIDVIVGPSNQNVEKLKSKSKFYKNISVYYAPNNIAEILVKSNFAIGGAGVSLLERMSLGVPTAVISLAPNQALAARDLAHEGLCFYLGSFEELSYVNLLMKLQLLAEQSDLIRKASIVGKRMVDGKGVDRVCKNLIYYSEVSSV